MVQVLNPYLPSSAFDAFVPDRLIGGDKKLVTMTGMIAGGQVLYRGSVMGLIGGSVTSAATTGNGGNGTLGGVAAGALAIPGVWRLTATSPTAFSVIDPMGATRNVATVGTPYVSNAIGFALTAGATPFAVGDSFTITVTAPTGEYLLSAAAATDGSQTPTAILVDAIDTTAGPLSAGLYLEGEFNANALYFGVGHDAQTVRTALRTVGIHIKVPVFGAPTAY